MTELRRITVKGIVDSNNSTATPLAGDATFTGTATEILDYGIIFVSVYSDVASATDGLVIEQSVDGTNWDHDDAYSVPAATGKNYSINPYAKYVRVKYTNGAGAQSTFRMQTVLKGNSRPSSHRIQDSIVDEDDAELVKSVLSAKANGGGFVNITATPSNNLRVANVEDGLSIAKGDVTDTSFVHKFGAAPDFDTGDGEVTVWDGSDDGTTWEKMVYTYSSSADIQYMSSSDAGDTVDIEIQGLDTNYDVVFQTKTLTGQTAVTLDTALIRVFRLKNVGATDLVGNVFVSTSAAGGTGIPTTADIRAIIQPENNQTEMAVYTVPDGYTAYMRSWYGSTAGANKTSNYIIRVKARPFGQVFQLKHRASLSDTGSSYIHHHYVEPEVFSAKTDIEMTVELTAVGAVAGAITAGFDIVLVAN